MQGCGQKVRAWREVVARSASSGSQFVEPAVYAPQKPGRLLPSSIARCRATSLACLTIMVAPTCSITAVHCPNDRGSAARRSRNQTRFVKAELALPEGMPRCAPTSDASGLYRSTRCRTIGIKGRPKPPPIDGSDPSGGGPMAGRGPAGSATRGMRKPKSIVR